MDEIKLGKRLFLWLFGVFLLVSVGTFIASRTVKTVDSGIIHYEEFQNIYNTCVKVNLDMCNMKNVPANDPMFDQFSKAQRINALQSQLNRWTEEYNAKSKEINHSLWKSSALPYQLTTQQFTCY